MSQKSAVPKALQKQVDVANAHLGHTGGEPAVPPATPPVQLAGDLAPAPAPAPAPTAPQPQPTPAAPAAPAPADDAATLRAELAALRASLDTLRGKYNAEVGAVQRENEHLRSQVTQLLSHQQPTAPAAPSATPDDVRRALDEANAIAGPELVKALETLCKHWTTEVASALVGQRIERVETAVHEVRAKTLDERLAERVPDVAAIEKLQVFQDYLQSLEPASGAQRLVLINDAYNKGDVDRVAWFFNDFKRLHAGAVPPTGGAPVQHAQPAPTGAPSLSDLAVPTGTPGGATPPTQQTKRNWKRETRDLFSRLRGQRQPWHRIPELLEAGLTGTEAEAKWLETEFQQAAMEGRLR
jgi:hypothetical protein